MIKSITVDTFTGIMKNEVIESWKGGAIKQTEWKDFGVAITSFLEELKRRGFTIVGVTGYPGSGKTTGMKGLEPETNIWFNADNKPAPYKGAKDLYGTPSNPTKFQFVPKDYDQILSVIDKIAAAGQLADEPVAFCLAHIEEFRTAQGETRLRMKTLGNLARKLDLEDNFTMVYYTKVESKSILEKPEFFLRTAPTGFDTCRTLEDLHDAPLIPNDYSLILKALEEY
jgi:hypothetical protein